MFLLNIAASVVLILLGTRYLRKGLDRLFGHRLLDWLERMTASRWRGFAAGVAAGAVAPSSSALVFLSLQVLRQSDLGADRVLAVFLGGCVGITVSVQLLAFHLQEYAGAFVAIGGAGFLFGKSAPVRGVGQGLLALGLIFLAMDVLGRTLAGLDSAQDLRVLFGVLEHYPLLLLGGAAVLTFLVQSSTAALALGLGLASGGLLSTAAMTPWTLGANLGIALTALVAGWASLEGRRLALANLFAKVLGAAGVLALAGLAPSFWERLLPGTTVAARTANLHTGFNLLVGLLTLPVLDSLIRSVRLLVPSPKLGAADAEASYLDDTLLESPALALNQATREQMRLMDELKFMLLATRVALGRGEPGPLAGLERHAVRFARIREDLGRYLSRMGGGESLDAAGSFWKEALLDYSFEVEAAERLVRSDLAEAIGQLLLAAKKEPGNRGAGRPADSFPTLDAEDRQRLDILYQRTLARLEGADHLLMTRDAEAAGRFIREKEEINALCRRDQRLLGAKSAATSRWVWQALVSLRRLNGHLTAVAYALHLPEQGSPSGLHDETAIVEPSDVVEAEPAHPPSENERRTSGADLV